jgi:hypothetical protein
MTFSVNQLWQMCGIPATELSISLSAPVYGKREFFLSLTGESEAAGFLIVPHIPPDRTITVRGIHSVAERFRPGITETGRIPPRRPVRTNSFVYGCRLRL